MSIGPMGSAEGDWVPGEEELEKMRQAVIKLEEMQKKEKEVERRKAEYLALKEKMHKLQSATPVSDDDVSSAAAVPAQKPVQVVAPADAPVSKEVSASTAGAAVVLPSLPLLPRLGPLPLPGPVVERKTVEPPQRGVVATGKTAGAVAFNESMSNVEASKRKSEWRGKEWRDGRMTAWRDGRERDRRDGRKLEWRDGRKLEWRDGREREWRDGREREWWDGREREWRDPDRRDGALRGRVDSAWETARRHDDPYYRHARDREPYYRDRHDCEHNSSDRCGPWWRGGDDWVHSRTDSRPTSSSSYGGPGRPVPANIPPQAMPVTRVASAPSTSHTVQGNTAVSPAGRAAAQRGQRANAPKMVTLATVVKAEKPDIP